ncbi:hypothetical protein [Kineosphaera limosa]|uniref:hypothetical protein n=1 Tax=Kineosphaera limosa TaxID=111564 RepID=UPI0035717730
MPIGAAVFVGHEPISTANTQERTRGRRVVPADLHAIIRADEVLRFTRPTELVLLAVTLEPCLMCLGAAITLGVDQWSTRWSRRMTARSTCWTAGHHPWSSPSSSGRHSSRVAWVEPSPRPSSPGTALVTAQPECANGVAGYLGSERGHWPTSHDRGGDTAGEQSWALHAWRLPSDIAARPCPASPVGALRGLRPGTSGMSPQPASAIEMS